MFDYPEATFKVLKRLCRRLNLIDTKFTVDKYTTFARILQVINTQKMNFQPVFFKGPAVQ
jgi:hypothetical protein